MFGNHWPRLWSFQFFSVYFHSHIHFNVVLTCSFFWYVWNWVSVPHQGQAKLLLFDRHLLRFSAERRALWSVEIKECSKGIILKSFTDTSCYPVLPSLSLYTAVLFRLELWISMQAAVSRNCVMYAITHKSSFDCFWWSTTPKPYDDASSDGIFSWVGSYSANALLKLSTSLICFVVSCRALSLIHRFLVLRRS